MTTPLEQLQEILQGVLEIEHAHDGLLCARFPDQTRLSFLFGEGGRLNIVVIQRGDVPELRANHKVKMNKEPLGS